MRKYLSPDQERQKRKKRAQRKKIKTWLTLAFCVVTLTTVAYRTCRNTALEERQSRLAASAQLTELAAVKVPDGDYRDAHMVHYPGFDVLFSPDHHQPYYSAWVLTPEHVRADKVKRQDKFTKDKKVKGCATTDDYRNSGYDRGHLAPAADMKYDSAAMKACFNLTNISPQHNNLNAKTWAVLEDQCRAWALRDSSLVIIAGPVLTDHLENKIGKTGVTVPDRFFKVILAPYANPPRAIGFVMYNGYNPGGVQQAAMTVDQVEEITGFDFFSALPDELENAIESEQHYTAWQYSTKKKRK